jgi:hypothetical protein
MENITKTNVIYARLTILALAINCILTGYMIFTLTKIQTDGLTEPTASMKSTAKHRTINNPPVR